MSCCTAAACTLEALHRATPQLCPVSHPNQQSYWRARRGGWYGWVHARSIELATRIVRWAVFSWGCGDCCCPRRPSCWRHCNASAAPRVVLWGVQGRVCCAPGKAWCATRAAGCCGSEPHCGSSYVDAARTQNLLRPWRSVDEEGSGDDEFGDGADGAPVAADDDFIQQLVRAVEHTPRASWRMCTTSSCVALGGCRATSLAATAS